MYQWHKVVLAKLRLKPTSSPFVFMSSEELAECATSEAMPNVDEIIRDHVTLTIDCVDRLYLNAYVPRLQS